MAVKHGKVFKATKGKHKGKFVKYAYTNGKKSTKRMVLHKGRSRR